MGKQKSLTQSGKEKYIKKAMENFEKLQEEIKPYLPKKGNPTESTTEKWIINSPIFNE